MQRPQRGLTQGVFEEPEEDQGGHITVDNRECMVLEYSMCSGCNSCYSHNGHVNGKATENSLLGFTDLSLSIIMAMACENHTS